MTQLPATHQGQKAVGDALEFDGFFIYFLRRVKKFEITAKQN
jgi:hypothetical protein